MDAQEKIRRSYMITVRQMDETTNYRLSYVPRGLMQERGAGGAPKRVPEFKATAQVRDDEILVKWEKAPSDPEAAQADFDQDVRSRVEALRAWNERLILLFSDIRVWAEELGWATSNGDKPVMDTMIADDYRAPGVVLERGTTRVGLEPINSAAPGTKGVVDLYLLPGYDDIASLFCYDDRWNLHYLAKGTQATASTRDEVSKPLTKKAFREVLDQIKKNG
jgi:hypothetical protein